VLMLIVGRKTDAVPKAVSATAFCRWTWKIVAARCLFQLLLQRLCSYQIHRYRPVTVSIVRRRSQQLRVVMTFFTDVRKIFRAPKHCSARISEPSEYNPNVIDDSNDGQRRPLGKSWGLVRMHGIAQDMGRREQDTITLIV